MPAAATRAPGAADWRALGRALAGRLLLPTTSGYDEARRPAVANYAGVRPAAIVRCAAPADVAETLSFAARRGLPVAPRSGGHCFAGRSSTTGIVIDVRPMDGVAVDGERATIGAGARLAGVYAALGAHGRTLPAGCGATVGIAGLTLGGGIGLLGRLHGLTCDRLRGARVVLADGSIVDCDEQRHSDLFWGLRGAGGGQVGVVTSLSFATVPEPVVTTFRLDWPAAAAAAVAAAWQRFAPQAPDELTVCLRVGAPADGRPVEVQAVGALLGSESAAAAALAELSAAAGAEPTVGGYATRAYGAAKQALGDEDPAGWRAARTAFHRRPLPAGAMERLVRALSHERRPGESRELAFTPMGGAYNRVGSAATAFAHRDAQFVLEHLSHAPRPAAGASWVERSAAVTHRWASGIYTNFPEPDAPPSAYHGENLERLARIKRAYDPRTVFGPLR